MSRPHGVIRKIKRALAATNQEISNHHARGGMFARGLASEGYAGGYRDALNDVLLALDGNEPNRYPYWPMEER